MKEIGEALKEARESIGIQIQEAANDLKLRPSQIEQIESGNIEAFKDVFYLKNYIKEYAKYLGLNYDDLIDDFNEYLFDYTSKISLEDIKRAKKKLEKNKKKEHKIKSPYILEHKLDKKIPILIVIAILVLIFIITLVAINVNVENPKQEDNLLALI